MWLWDYRSHISGLGESRCVTGRESVSQASRGDEAPGGQSLCQGWELWALSLAPSGLQRQGQTTGDALRLPLFILLLFSTAKDNSWTCQSSRTAQTGLEGPILHVSRELSWDVGVSPG